MEIIEKLTAEIMADPQNSSYTKQGIKPLFTIPKTARINIVGQAPGIRAQESGLYWNDPSGDNLREWLGVSKEQFYNSGLFAIIPMDFISPATENQAIYRQGRALLKSGTSEFLLSLQI